MVYLGVTPLEEDEPLATSMVSEPLRPAELSPKWSFGLISLTLLVKLSGCFVLFELVEMLRWLLRSLIKSFGLVRICDCICNGCG